ncbi:MAG TPA: thiamine phosphate synthase [Leucothrix sp.]|nr:thiamine phosphate synthase [Leucothrix sp.]
MVASEMGILSLFIIHLANHNATKSAEMYITPNLDELALLTNLPTNNQAEIEHASKQLIALGVTSVLVKGGHSLDAESSTDLLITESSTIHLIGKRWKDRKNVRGTGCALATTIAVMMSKGYCLEDAVVLAKANLSHAIRHAVINRGGQRKLRFKAEEYLHIDLQDFPKLITSKAHKVTPDFLSCGSKPLGVYPIVDSVEWIKKLVPLGIETIQLRIKTETKKPKNQSIEEMEQRTEQQIQEAITFCNAYKVRLFINDHWRIAIKHKAYGIHLGQEDLAKLSHDDLQSIADAKCRLGVSTHSFFEVARAHQLKPSYIALGPIFATTSKVMPWIPQGVATVKMWVHLLGDEYPLVAIGGINAERAKVLKATGVGSVAMITAITEADDYEKATKDLLLLWEASKYI